MAEKDGQVERLEQEAKGLRARLAQAEEVLRAIREGELEIAPGSDGSGSASTKPNLRLRLGQAAMRTVAQQLERKMRGQTADLRATVEQLQGRFVSGWRPRWHWRRPIPNCR